MTFSTAISIATYERPEGLARLLRSIEHNIDLTHNQASVVIVIVDNSPSGTAVDVARDCRLPAHYFHEPTPGIVAARNRGIEESLKLGTDTIAFVDDDETVDVSWLRSLAGTMEATGADVVTGPVVYELPTDTPTYVRAAPYFRTRHEDHRSAVTDVATNNTLVKASWFIDGHRFDQKYSNTGGSDKAFFLSIHELGARMVWAGDAVVTEQVPAERATVPWVLQRDKRNGQLAARLAREFEGRGRLPLLIRAGLKAGKGVCRYSFGLLVRSETQRFEARRSLSSANGWVRVALGSNLYSEYGQ